MTAPAPGTQTRALAYLENHPGRTAWEIAIGLGYQRDQLNAAAGTLFALLRHLQAVGQVVPVTEYRPQQGREVNLWHLAPARTHAPASPGQAGRRAHSRARQRRSRAQRQRASLPVATAAWGLPSGPACAKADPDLFFPLLAQSADPAKAICAGCQVRAACLARARANGERYGIWGGVDLGAEHGAAWSA